MRRHVYDALISAGALALLLVALIAIDARVRDHLVQSVRGATVAGAGATLADLGSIVLLVVRDQSIAHAPLAIFVIAAAVLVLFMLRT